MRVGFIGCLESSRVVLSRTLCLPNVQVAGVVTRTSSAFNADFCSLESVSVNAGVPCFSVDGNRQDEIAAWLRSVAPDVIYCVGWPFLLRREILDIPRLGVIGYHPTELPRNRGRHPIIWTLALGLTRTASTFFFMDEGADSGDVLAQRVLSVERSDDAASLYRRLMDTALDQLEEFTALLVAGPAPRVPQDHARATYWRRRTPADGRIDWRMPAEGIFNLVRALAPPYPGADCPYGVVDVKVWRSEVVSDAYAAVDLSSVEPGRVLRSDEAGVDVRCGIGVLRVTYHAFGTPPEAGVAL